VSGEHPAGPPPSGAPGASGPSDPVDGRAALADAVMRLLACADPRELLLIALRDGLAGIALPAGLLVVVRPDGWLELLTRIGAARGPGLPVDLVAPDAALPAAVAARERRPVHVLPGPGVVSSLPPPMISLPLLAGDRCVGALSAQLAVPGELPREARRTLATIATVCAHRLGDLLAEEHPGARAGVAPDRPPAAWPGGGRELRLELAMAGARIGSFVWDIESGELTWDERLCELWGFDPATFDGNLETFYASIHPDDLDRVRRLVDESLVGGVYRAVYRIIRTDGAVRWIDARGRVSRRADGRPRAMVGVALDRTEEREEEARREARRDFVLRITRAFAGAVTTKDVLDTMTGVVLPALGARALAVHLERDGRLELAGARGYPEEDMPRLRAVGRVRGRANPLNAVLATGAPMLFESRADYLTRFPDPRAAPAPAHRAFAFLPLTTSDGTLGTCLISYGEPHVFRSEDQVVLASLTGILGQALARGRLIDERRARMAELQRVMLPRELPRLDGLDVAVRYLPGTEGMHVGGDWYDVLPHPEGGATLVVGDVQGHNATAAAVMGQLRIAMAAHALDGHRAEHLMRRANRMLDALDTDRFATCCVADVEPGGRAARLVRAGHPLPLLAGPGGETRELNCASGLPLGIRPGEDYPVTRVELAAGSTLLLYTDGLVERPGRAYDDAVRDVADVLAADRGDDLDALADAVVAPAAARGGHDDIAVLLVRVRDG
jgi:PAS domain S-box-containing protein